VSHPALSSSILKSLRLGHMDPELPAGLLTSARNKARNRTENRYWDYKEKLTLDDPYQVAEFAKDVLAFHNTEGGVIIVGIADEYTAKGVPASTILDTKTLRDKIRKFLQDIPIFQDSTCIPRMTL
jgi:hypothetical protein